jgi:hypothetical protein
MRIKLITACGCSRFVEEKTMTRPTPTYKMAILTGETRNRDVVTSAYSIREFEFRGEQKKDYYIYREKV